jgi:hypothetical protein
MVSKSLLISSLLLAPICLTGQTAKDYFHGGAQFYIFGEKQKAVTEVQSGLQKFPDDADLRKLAELLAREEKEQQQQAQQTQKGEQNDKQNQEQQKQSREQKEKQEQEQARQQKEKQEQEQQQQQAQNQNEQQPNQSSGQKEKEQPANQKESSTGYAAGQMTLQQAQQLLDAQKNEELVLPVKPEEKPVRAQRKLRDW